MRGQVARLHLTVPDPNYQQDKLAALPDTTSTATSDRQGLTRKMVLSA